MELSKDIKEQLNMVKVKNVQGHYKIPSGYNSWLNYWERKMNKIANACQKNRCNVKDKDKLEGGHVYKVWDENTIFLVPICYDHNHYTFTDEYEVPDDMLLEVPKEDLVRDVLKNWLEDIKKGQKEK